MNEVWRQLKQIWGKFTQGQRWLVIGTSAAVVLGVVVAITAGSSTEWRTLAADVPRKDVQKLLAKLDDAGIPFRLEAQGTTVDVPADRWSDVQRVVMDNELLVKNAGRGYDSILGINITDTREQAEYKRLIAQQDELEIAIERQEGIEEATLYITPAKNHWSKEGSERAKAAVMLRLAPGYLTTGHQVEAIVRFVAGAVKELDPQNVIVTDTRGVVLARPNEGEATLQTSVLLNHAYGLRLRAAAQEALDQAFGGDRTIVSCNVDLDLERVRTETDGFIPGSKVVLKETLKSEMNTRPSGGVVSTSQEQAGRSSEAAGSRTEDTETSYDHGRRKEVRIRDGGDVKNLTVSVLAAVDLTASAVAIESIVKSAVGYMEARGDVWNGVQFVPFNVPQPMVLPEPPGMWTGEFVWQLVRWAITGLVGIAMVFVISRSARRARESVQGVFADIAVEHGEPIVEVRAAPEEEIKDLVKRDADAVSRLLRNWLYEPAGSR
jgi:flagellar M-ring protein FliF